MKITHSLLTLLIILTHRITLLGNPDDLKLVPFDQKKYGADHERIFLQGLSELFYETQKDQKHISHKITLLNGKVIGFISYASSSFDNIYSIKAFAIDKDYQKKGYGKKTLQLFEDVARADNKTELWAMIPEHNEPFYKKCGFSCLAGFLWGKNLTLESETTSLDTDLA